MHSKNIVCGTNNKKELKYYNNTIGTGIVSLIWFRDKKMCKSTFLFLPEFMTKKHINEIFYNKNKE